jgi:hypothetical protein
MEVIHDDRRARRQPGGVVGDRRGDISRHRPVHRQQADGIGAKTGFDCPRRLDKASPDRAGSASALSHESQDVMPGGRAAAQSASSTVLPAPADPATTVSR